MLKRTLPAVLLAMVSVGLRAQTYNIKDYGVVDDTMKTCTAAIQRAIDACHEAGGGVVLVPAGLYKSGTLVLKDNVELHLSSGAQLVASADYRDFAVFPPTGYRSLKDAGGWVSLIYADSAKHISITGRGAGRRGFVSGVPGDCNGRPRNIRISNITARNTGNFCSSITGIPGRKIENITLANISLTNRGGLHKGAFRTAGDDNGVRHDSGKRLFLDRYWSKADDVKEDEKGYPQPTVWGNLPCYGLFFRHVENVNISGLELKSDGEEPREPIIVVDVDKLTIDGKNK